MMHKSKKFNWAVNMIPTMGVLFSLIVKEPQLTRPKSAEKWAPEHSEDASWARNQLEGGIDFDIIDEIRKQDSWPISYPQLVKEAILTTQAKAYGLGIFNLAVTHQNNPRAMRELWESMKDKEDPFLKSGASDFAKTKFETFRVREHLYSNDWAPSLFRVQNGPNTYYAGLNDQYVMRAVQWLEGDDSVENLATSKQRYRNDGGYLVELATGRKFKKGKRKGQPITVKVWVQPAAFLPWAFEDKDSIMGDASFSHIELKRGLSPLRRLHQVKAARAKMEAKWKGPIGDAARAWLKAWGDPKSLSKLEVVEEQWIEQLCVSDEEDTVVVLEPADLDEVSSVV